MFSSTKLSRCVLAGDVWGGLAAMLVALPGAIAFGVSIYAPLGADGTAQGAIAGITGAVIIGIVAPIFGGTDRLVSAPCAPAAAVLGAFALELTHGPGSLGLPQVLTLMTLTALLAGGLQILFGVLGGGTLIKYIPYPVVTGYLSGVGMVIFLNQLPSLFGWSEGSGLWQGLTFPEGWHWPSLAVGLVTIAIMVLARRLTRAVPAAILALLGGIVVYFALGQVYPELLTVVNNPLVIGPLDASGGNLGVDFMGHWTGLVGIGFDELKLTLVPALTLSVLLSIDTLKTCVVVDALTYSHHDSNREILGQGIANLCAVTAGGIPGAGTAGATLVNIESGSRTRFSSVLAGVFALITALSLGSLVAWLPIAALAGILVVVAFRMFDWKSVKLLRHRSTVFDFVVIVTVVVLSVSIGLVAASGVGVALAILLFIRDQAQGSVIRRRITGDRLFSHKRRPPHQVEVLERCGVQTLVCELQDNLFFGTTDQLFTTLEADLQTCRYLILDLRWVRGVDYTGIHVLKQIEARLRRRGAHLLISALGTVGERDLRAYFREAGLLGHGGRIKVFDQLSDALEWVEDRWLAEEGIADQDKEPAIALQDIGFNQDCEEEALDAFRACVAERSFQPGEAIFQQGDDGDQMYFVRRGSVHIELVFGEDENYHIATCGRGDFFGEITFLDHGRRSANAVAAAPTELFEISRRRFDEVADQYPQLARYFNAHLAQLLAIRLRHANGEIRALEES